MTMINVCTCTLESQGREILPQLCHPHICEILYYLHSELCCLFSNVALIIYTLLCCKTSSLVLRILEVQIYYYYPFPIKKEKRLVSYWTFKKPDIFELQSSILLASDRIIDQINLKNKWVLLAEIMQREKNEWSLKPRESTTLVPSYSSPVWPASLHVIPFSSIAGVMPW